MSWSWRRGIHRNAPQSSNAPEDASFSAHGVGSGFQYVVGVVLTVTAAACQPRPATLPAPHSEGTEARPTVRESLDEAVDRFGVTFAGYTGTVAVLDFPDLEQRATTTGKLVSQSLTTALVVAAGGRRLRVLERLQVDQVLKELSFQAAQVSDADIERVGRALGADALILGTAAQLGSEWILNVRMVDVRSRAILTAARATVSASSVPGSAPAAATRGLATTPSGAPRAPTPAAAPTQRAQRRYDWEIAVNSCTADAAFLDCRVSITNRGEDRFTRISACNVGVMEGNLQYCTRAYLGEGIVLPMQFVSADQTVGNGRGLSERNGFNVLAGRSVSIVVRAENPPLVLRSIRRLAIMVDLVERPGWSPRSESLDFADVPVVNTGDAAPSGARSAATIGFRLDLEYCRRSGRDVECRVAISNHDFERTLGFDEVGPGRVPMQGTNRAFDDRGNAYPLSQIDIGTGGRNAGDRRMPAGDTLPMRFQLLNVDPSATALTAIELHGRAWPSYPYNTAPQVVFRNVPIRP